MGPRSRSGCKWTSRQLRSVSSIDRHRHTSGAAMDRKRPDTNGILERVRSGDAESLNELFCRHEAKLLRLIGIRMDARVRRRGDPEDVLQEARLRAIRRLDDYLSNSAMPFFLWISTITSETLIDFHRRHLGAKARDVRREARVDALSENGSDFVGSPNVIASKAPAPLVELERAETRRRVWAVLEAMNENDRDVLLLRLFEGLSNAETAIVLGLEERTASKRFQSALKRAQLALEPLPRSAASRPSDRSPYRCEDVGGSRLPPAE
jgi:RNA polymerase sigma-70 factor (ECF subfamily)